MPATYSFFETATQKGYLLQVFGELIPRHWDRVIEADAVGTKFRFAAARHGQDEILIDVTIEGRGARESQSMWRDRARGEAEKAWEKYKAKRAAKELERTGSPDTGTQTSQTLSPSALSTPSTTESEKSLGPLPVEESGKSDSDPSGPTPSGSKSTRISIRNSKRT